MIIQIIKTEEEWRQILSPEQYRVMREHGTEGPGSCEFKAYKGNGIYYCAACGLPLFKAVNKFESGTGWPSFNEPFDQDNLLLKTDLSFGMKRVEVRCARCQSHLGHVFEDGPLPSGLRFCVNGVVLNFKSDGHAENN